MRLQYKITTPNYNSFPYMPRPEAVQKAAMARKRPKVCGAWGGMGLFRSSSANNGIEKLPYHPTMKCSFSFATIECMKVVCL